MAKFSFKRLLNIIDRVECEEIRTLCEKKDCNECKPEKPKCSCFSKNKKEVR